MISNISHTRSNLGEEVNISRLYFLGFWGPDGAQILLLTIANPNIGLFESLGYFSSQTFLHTLVLSHPNKSW